MDSTTIWIIIAVVALLALFFYNRSRPAPRGTYDDKNVRSSGSIGGGTHAYDDPAYRSSGSIGGGQGGYDAPAQKSSGSIGESSNHRLDPDTPSDRLESERVREPNEATRARIASERQHDDDHFKSKGSIGG